MRANWAHSRSKRSFTLVEMLVAVAITLIIVVVLANILAIVSKSWKQADTRITSFESARFAFERITRTLSQATLNPYWDFVDANGNRRTTANATTFIPASYARCSDQAFLIGQASTYSATGQNWACFFQSPLGQTDNQSLIPLDNLLNTTGFFVEFNNDKDATTLSMKPSYITAAKWRYRLMELLEPTENLSVFTSYTSGTTSTYDKWVSNAMDPAESTQPTPDSPNRQARPIADNIIALVFLAEDTNGKPLPTTAPTYSYDSRNQSVSSTWNQLPAQVQVTMVAIDEGSATRLAAANGANPPALVKASYFTDPGTVTVQGNPATQYATDLAALEADLTANPAHLNYRVFNTTVRIEAAQWSSN